MRLCALWWKVLLQMCVHVYMRFVNLTLGRCKNKIETSLALPLKSFSKVQMGKYKT